MSKAVLVIDMPENCADCPMRSMNLYDMSKTNIYCQCNKASDIPWELARKEKPDWCPLRELPEKKLYNGVEGIIGIGIPERGSKAVDEAAALGWNAYINAIVGTKE